MCVCNIPEISITYRETCALSHPFFWSSISILLDSGEPRLTSFSNNQHPHGVGEERDFWWADLHRSINSWSHEAFARNKYLEGLGTQNAKSISSPSSFTTLKSCITDRWPEIIPSSPCWVEEVLSSTLRREWAWGNPGLPEVTSSKWQSWRDLVSNLVFCHRCLTASPLEELEEKHVHKSLERKISVVPDFMTPWTVAHQAPLSMEFSRQEYWSELPFPSPGDLPNPGIEPGSLTLWADALLSEPPGNPTKAWRRGQRKGNDFAWGQTY